MKKVTEFDLMQALWDCSCYVRDLPTKEEVVAIKHGVSDIFYRWVEQQDLSYHKKQKLFEKVMAPGALDKAARKALSKRYSS